LGLAAAARGLYLDGKNKLRCGPGNPGANRFTNIIGVGCDIPGSPDVPDGPAGSVAAKINNDKTPDVPKFRKLSAVIDSLQSNIRPLRYDKKKLSLFDDNGVIVASGLDSPESSAVGTMISSIVSELTRLAPVSNLRERAKRKKAEQTKARTDLKNAKKSITGTPVEKSVEMFRRTKLDLEERINARLRANGDPEISIDSTFLEQASPVQISGTFVQPTVPDGSGGQRPLNNLEVTVLGYDQTVVQIMNRNASDKEVREARANALSRQLGVRITERGLREKEEMLSEIIDAMTIHLQSPSAEFEDISVIPLRIYWGSEREMTSPELIDDENPVLSNVLVYAMIPGVKTPFSDPDGIDADDFGNTFGLSTSGVPFAGNRTLTPVEAELLDLQIAREVARRNPGISASDIDSEVTRIKERSPGELQGIMSQINTPAYAALMINPRILKEDELWKFMQSGGEHYLVNGKPKNTSDYIQDLMDHEMNHINDYYNRVRTIAGIGKSKWLEILSSGQPLNFRTLASYNPNSILAAQLRNLDLRVGAARDDIEKASVLMQWYMENYKFNEDLRERYRDWAKRKGYTKQKIQDVLDGIKDALGARGINGDYEWWYEAFINAFGEQDPTFRFVSRDAVASKDSTTQIRSAEAIVLSRCAITKHVRPRIRRPRLC
jgi:hypothetical protein